MSKYHWRSRGTDPACGRDAQTFASGMYYNEGGAYFADESGRRVAPCLGCLLVAIGEVIATFQAEQRIGHHESA